MTARVTLLPSARRLMDSLREIGYDLPTGIADIVDNSIAAGATRVDVTFAFEGADSWIRIADDGAGMTAAVLDEAMRYGTQRSYVSKDLGRFGLGLKTASLSQCRRLTVASRRGRERRRIEIRQWDLDHVARSNRWEVLRLDPARTPAELVGPLLEHPGTVVLWEGLDRVLDYRLPDGAAARHGFALLADEVRAHASMVFHRFLAGEVTGRAPLTATLNGSAIQAWDPYARTEPHTRELAAQVIPFPDAGRSAKLVVRPFILPPQERFSSSAAHLIASGPQRWNRQQGFYFYRNDRLIQAGGWNRLRTIDEHTKLARVAVELPEGCDDFFRVNVTKMRVSVPPTLRDALLAIASGVVAEASASYRRAAARDAAHASNTRASSSTRFPSLVSTLTLDERDILITVADLAREEFRDEPDILRRLLSRIERLPAPSRATDASAIPLVGRRARRRTPARNG